jgi:hypothetical protein
MLKQTEAYRAALEQLADALAEQEPAAVLDDATVEWDSYKNQADLVNNLFGLLRRRLPDFVRKIDRIREEREQQWEKAQAAWRAENVIPF